ncbi:hypothetical protein BGZ60DRAFT_129375 [Tricladium varicosporioides]|nr:hypothetical protein BGZ60DRAFT_129375 [Hymenoscyphus varicosporioides]
MGEFHEAVSTLLDAFARGISIIKIQNRQLKDPQITTAADTHLSKSLSKNRAEVKNAYQRDLDRFGDGFAAGDTESRSSLSTILSRLSTGFLSVIERFSRGKSTPADYQALMSLSDLTRRETLKTFEQLSIRLSNSSLALVPSSASKEKQVAKSFGKKRSATSRPAHTRAKSAPSLSSTPLGPATTSGWVRPKKSRKSSSKSQSTSSMRSKREEHSRSPPRLKIEPPPPPPACLPSPPPQRLRRTPPAVASPRDRKSFMSFASNSTKLGEIPEHKWARPPGYEQMDASLPITAYYPLEPYQEPAKPRSRLARLFKRS